MAGWIVGVAVALASLVAVAFFALRVVRIVADSDVLDEYVDEDD